MPLYRNLYMVPRFLRGTVDQQFHSAACQLVRIEPFRARATDAPPSTGGGAPLQPLTQVHAFDVVTKLNASEREALRQALSRFEADSVASKLEGTAALTPSREDLMKLMVVNSVPFVGFGFLDNFLMIIAGDYIESTLGMYMAISTMAAAALGNTISDVMGLGLAHHVEAFCLFIGIRPPKLTAEQIDGKACRRVMSYGRALGITVGCIIGMLPLYFMNKKPKVQAPAQTTETTTVTTSKVA